MITEIAATINWWKEKSPVARMYLSDEYFHHGDWESLNNGQITKMWREETFRELIPDVNIRAQVCLVIGANPRDFVDFEDWISHLTQSEALELRNRYYPGQNFVECVDWLSIFAQRRVVN